MRAFALCAVSPHRRRRTCAADPALHAAASAANDLRAARRVLRRKNGREPCVLDAAVYAAARGVDIDPDPAGWLRVFEARNAITEEWMWLVDAAARKLHSSYHRTAFSPTPSLSLKDMVQEGMCGLMTAAERWDPARGSGAFEQYAYFCIKHAILRAIENQARPVRLPVHVHNKLARLRKAHRRLEAGGRAASLTAIAEEAGLEPVDVRLYVERSQATQSLDAPPLSARASHGDSSLLDFLADPSADIEKQLEIAYAREALAHIVRCAGLERLELSVLTLKYGLNDGVERLRSDVSRILEINGARVRRVELKALRKLRLQMDDEDGTWSELF